MARQTKAEKQIEQCYYDNCSGIQINIMDIGKVFAEGRKALAEGRDLKTAIISFVETIRVDGKKREQPAMSVTVV
jgi:hypothetical protein